MSQLEPGDNAHPDDPHESVLPLVRPPGLGKFSAHVYASADGVAAEANWRDNPDKDSSQAALKLGPVHSGHKGHPIGPAAERAPENRAEPMAYSSFGPEFAYASSFTSAIGNVPTENAYGNDHNRLMPGCKPGETPNTADGCQHNAEELVNYGHIDHEDSGLPPEKGVDPKPPQWQPDNAGLKAKASLQMQEKYFKSLVKSDEKGKYTSTADIRWDKLDHSKVPMDQTDSEDARDVPAHKLKKHSDGTVSMAVPAYTSAAYASVAAQRFEPSYAAQRNLENQRAEGKLGVHGVRLGDDATAKWDDAQKAEVLRMQEEHAHLQGVAAKRKAQFDQDRIAFNEQRAKVIVRQHAEQLHAQTKQPAQERMAAHMKSNHDQALQSLLPQPTSTASLTSPTPPPGWKAQQRGLRDSQQAAYASDATENNLALKVAYPSRVQDRAPGTNQRGDPMNFPDRKPTEDVNHLEDTPGLTIAQQTAAAEAARIQVAQDALDQDRANNHVGTQASASASYGSADLSYASVAALHSQFLAAHQESMASYGSDPSDLMMTPQAYAQLQTQVDTKAPQYDRARGEPAVGLKDFTAPTDPNRPLLNDDQHKAKLDLEVANAPRAYPVPMRGVRAPAPSPNLHKPFVFKGGRLPNGPKEIQNLQQKAQKQLDKERSGNFMSLSHAQQHAYQSANVVDEMSRVPQEARVVPIPGVSPENPEEGPDQQRHATVWDHPTVITDKDHNPHDADAADTRGVPASTGSPPAAPVAETPSEEMVSDAYELSDLGESAVVGVDDDSLVQTLD
jgi:hypothetical protein